ncbi:MAG: YaiI/YqxD family protein [Desulfobacterales bacterium]|nr:YaiI/YqxD family protein [Desulfobacterales bacterium]MCP4158489.1 YaiI/YqxD family protein [Deltaproteobacteria bacterium]
MKIWVDADACPVVIKNILFKAADRVKVELILVANQVIKMPRSKYIKMLQVSAGFDEADNEIVSKVEKGDLVITADIPLAAEVIGKGGLALNPRGELYSEDTIKEKLNMRDFMDTLRSGGIETGGPKPLNQKNRNEFANQLDKLLTKLI